SPRFPDPKFEISASAKPPMMATTIRAMIHVPTLDFETRRKKVSIGFRKKREEDCRFTSRAGAHQAAPLGRSKRQGNGLEETRRGQLEDARPVVRPRRGSGDCRGLGRLSGRGCRVV